MWAKIVAGMGAVIGFLLVVLKFKNNKIENLEEENQAFEAKDEITDDMRLAEIQAELKQNEALKDNDGANWRDSI